MYKVKVYVTLRKRIRSTRNSSKGALHSLSFTEVQDVRIGKYMELTIDKSVSDLDSKVKEMCEKLLANVVMEDFRYEVEEVVAQ